MTESMALAGSRLRFRLRSFLLAVAAVCVALALLAWWLGPSQTWRTPGAAVVVSGGLYRALALESESLFAAGQDELHQNVVSLDLSPPETTSAWLSHLEKLTRLERLTAYGGAFNDGHLATVGRLPRLSSLVLRGANVTPESVARLRTERPELKITVEPLEITFRDLAFDLPLGQGALHSTFTPRIRSLDHSRVRIRGYIFPAAATFTSRFTLTARVRYACRDGPDPLCELIRVGLRPGLRVNFTTDRVVVTGTLIIAADDDSLLDETGAFPIGFAYRMVDCTVSPEP